MRKSGVESSYWEYGIKHEDNGKRFTGMKEIEGIYLKSEKSILSILHALHGEICLRN
jgi:hypothetical protein